MYLGHTVTFVTGFELSLKLLSVSFQRESESEVNLKVTPAPILHRLDFILYIKMEVQTVSYILFILHYNFQTITLKDKFIFSTAKKANVLCSNSLVHRDGLFDTPDLMSINMIHRLVKRSHLYLTNTLTTVSTTVSPPVEFGCFFEEKDSHEQINSKMICSDLCHPLPLSRTSLVLYIVVLLNLSRCQC